MKCLNIGCGSDYKQSKAGEVEWINIDKDINVKADERMNVIELHNKYESQIDYILAQDILEHIRYDDSDKTMWKDCLRSWYKCLKIGGTIQIQVPDPYAIFEQFKNGEISESEMIRLVYGENTNEYDKHYQLISLARLAEYLEEIGFRIITKKRLNICAIINAIRD